jgi:hypothetical protein
LTLDYTIPNGMTQLQVQIRGGHTAGTVWVDDLTVCDVTAAKAAQTRADQAVKDAATAQTAANQAQSSASSAASAAAAAQATASKAWNQVDSYTRSADDIGEITVVSGVAPVVAAEATGLRGKVWRKSGTGTGVWVDRRGLIQVKPDSLYRMSVTLRVVTDSTVSASGRLYAGLAGYAANGTTFVNTAGANSASTQHYIAASNQTLKAADGWVTVQGYAQGWDIPGTETARPDPDDPGRLHSNAVFAAPVMFLDYNGGNGVWEVSHWSIDSIPVSTQWSLRATRDALASTAATLATQIQQSQESVLLAASQKYQTVGAAAAFQEEMTARLQLTATEIQTVFTRAAQLVDTVDGGLRQEVTARESMIRLSGDGIQMGVASSPFEMRLDNDSLDFLANGVVQAFFGQDRLLIQTAEILRALVLGPWSMTVDSNSNLNVRRS